MNIIALLNNLYTNKKCDWIGNQKELQQVTKTKDGVWRCPKCGKIFFVYVLNEKAE